MQIAGADALAQDVHLLPGVVEIVFAGHGVAHRLQQIRNRIANHAAPDTMHAQRPGWVSAHVFDLRRFAAARALLENAITRRDNVIDLPHQPRVREVKIQKARRNRVHLADKIRHGQMGQNRPGNLNGWLAHLLLNLHGNRRGIIALIRVFGTLNFQRRDVEGGQRSGGLRRADGVPDDVGDLLRD